MSKCECHDKGCRHHLGATCSEPEAFIVVFRIDMQDASGTAMCEICSEDALETGVFATEAP